MDRAQWGVVPTGQQFLHQGSPGLAEVQALEAAALLQPLHRLEQHLVGAPGLGGDLGGGLAGIAASDEAQEGAVDRRVQLRAVGLGDQDAVAPALADRVDVRCVEAVAHHDLAAVAQLSQLADQVAASHRLHRDHHQLGLELQGGGDRDLEVVVGQLGALHRDGCKAPGLEGLLEDQHFGGAVGVVLGVEHRHPLDGGVAPQGLGDRERRDYRALGRHSADEGADLGDPLGGVRRGHHRHTAALGDRVGGEGLLGESGADQGQDPLLDQQVEGGDGRCLIAAAVLQLELQGAAGWIARCQGKGFRPPPGQIEAQPLVLAVEVGVAGEGDHGPDREGAAGSTDRSHGLGRGIGLLAQDREHPDRCRQEGGQPQGSALTAIQSG